MRPCRKIGSGGGYFLEKFLGDLEGVGDEVGCREVAPRFTPD